MTAPNVLLLVLDSVRAQNLGLYGYHRDTAPFLSEYAQRSTLYTQSRAPGIHSVASHASLWTGRNVEEHMAIRHEDRLSPGTTVWETLGDEGYETGIFTTNPVVAHSSNLATPFETQVTDDYTDNSEKPFPEAHGPADVVRHEGISGNLRRALRDDQPLKALLNSGYHFVQQKRGGLNESLESEKIVEEFLRWQDETSRPWAACINLMDAHFPYEPADRYDMWGGDGLADLHAELDKPPANEFVGGRPWWQLQAFEHLYDGAIRELDEHISRVISGLEGRGVHDDTLVVITSDHGEGFGEVSRLTGRTKLVDHSWGIHEALTHVPLVVKYPGQSDPSVIDDPATLTRFPAAVTGVLDGDASPGLFVPDGPVISSTYRLREEDDLIFDESDERATDYYGPWRAVYERVDGVVRKYAKRGNDSLVVDVLDAQRARALDADGSQKVESTFESVQTVDVVETAPRTVSDGVEDRLSELGYLR